MSACIQGKEAVAKRKAAKEKAAKQDHPAEGSGEGPAKKTKAAEQPKVPYLPRNSQHLYLALDAEQVS